MNLRLFYGGTFDPIHHGHLAIARAAHDALGCDVRFMPAADPPHRAAPGADAAQRVEMLGLALADEPGLRIDLRELQREGRSYTHDTLLDMRREYGGDVPIALLIGGDSLLGLPTWREWRALFGLTHFVVADRPGNALDARLPDELADALAGRWTDDPGGLRDVPAGHLFRLRQPLHPGSATDIRRRIADGRPWDSLLPPLVASYIRRHGLYGAAVDEAPTPPPL